MEIQIKESTLKHMQKGEGMNTLSGKSSLWISQACGFVVMWNTPPVCFHLSFQNNSITSASTQLFEHTAVSDQTTPTETAADCLWPSTEKEDGNFSRGV